MRNFPTYKEDFLFYHNNNTLFLCNKIEGQAAISLREYPFAFCHSHLLG